MATKKERAKFSFAPQDVNNNYDATLAFISEASEQPAQPQPDAPKEKYPTQDTPGKHRISLILPDDVWECLLDDMHNNHIRKLNQYFIEILRERFADDKE